MISTVFFTFWTIFFSVLSVHRGWALRHSLGVRERLSRLLHPLESPADSELLLPGAESLTGQRLQEALVLAGLRRKSDFRRMQILKRVCFVLPFISVLLLFLIDLPLGGIVVLSGFLFLLFILIPRFLILRSIFKRRREIEKALPDTLDLLILCLEAGLSFDSALVRVAEETRRVSSQLSRELVVTHQEILVGKTREEALRSLGERCGVEDLRSLLGAILQSIKMGTSLVRTLKIQADMIRKKRREKIRGEILKTPVKLIFPLLFFIFPILLIVILGPSLIQVFRHLDEVGP